MECLSLSEYEQFTDIASDAVLKQKFFSSLYASWTEEYPEVFEVCFLKTAAVSKHIPL